MEYSGVMISGAVAAALFLGSTSASAQSPAQAPPRASSWHLAGGVSWFGLRDVARTRRPVDASPVRWASPGQTVILGHERIGRATERRLELVLQRHSAFEYVAPVGDPRPRPGDHQRGVRATFDYGWIARHDAFVRGLDLMLGGRALGAVSSLRRDVATALVTTETLAGGGLGVKVGARFARGRVRVDADMTNGVQLLRLSERQSAQTSAQHRWGGGWLTDLGATAGWSVGSRTAIVAGYARTGDAVLSNHQTFTTTHGTFTLGVRHAR